MNPVRNPKIQSQTSAKVKVSAVRVSNGMKTYSAKPNEVVRAWYVLDASEVPLGRLATVAAKLLTGKDKPMFTKHIDCGDNVIVINADKLVVTGQKLTDKKYYRHSGYPGGLKTASLQEVIEKDSSRAVIHAIRGMLPVNKLRDGRLLRLKVYPGTEHNHAAQKPVAFSLTTTAKAKVVKKEGKE